METATSAVASAAWGWSYNKNLTTDATGTAIGTGKSNTETILAVFAANNYTDTTLAKERSDYSVTNGGVTYDDWFMPSIYGIQSDIGKIDKYDKQGGSEVPPAGGSEQGAAEVPGPARRGSRKPSPDEQSSSARAYERRRELLVAYRWPGPGGGRRARHCARGAIAAPCRRPRPRRGAGHSRRYPCT